MLSEKRITIFQLRENSDLDQISLLLDSGICIENLCEYQIEEWEKNKISLGERNFGNEFFYLNSSIKTYLDALFIYYPWRKTGVFSFSREVFTSLRYLRNRYKINEIEQSVLREKTVAIVGMSVGMSVLKAMALEGLAGKYVIADFDKIEITNLNRIDSGVFSIGKLKVDRAYQFLMEQDPFIEVELCTEPIAEENISIVVNPAIDLVIDECDSISTKILIRRIASELSIPVIMHTSDRGMLDVERYDLKNFDSTWTLLKYARFTNEEIRENQLNIIADFCELKNAQKRSLHSFSEIGRSLTSWPQLGGDVLAGGGNVATASRLYLLGENIRAGRYYLDPSKEFLPDSNG